MQIVNLIIAILTFGKALVDYIDRRESRKLSTREKVNQLRDFKTALKEGNADEIETLFTRLRPASLRDGRCSETVESASLDAGHARKP